ncbi:hypothetical protein ACH95_21225 [Bacillus glycinifermentans]|mgnify:CR=1 FL=1|uniref:SMI1/KNR4 family protein n=1 Tax=Bacillus glycinifermentans TaxID=1664069 RepID=A0A0J6EIY5_9BACI|nr:hypothetical protein [Bacillus glycinifermentans]ATH92919.1 hypothetical protein COP00_10165 [Bacillus glycinifermentans]KMM53699.1 hypothetical protein ACH95_21225 [Bacillus glycinifermentans]KRT94132.1 hypothetical protein AB447_202240 [Bacillus glycinifermentans]MEC0486389.1 hypothetical protein [Bacillus glycinifermentans]MEC0493305.1 hypothetical protein [Bacillus glycinifermentans]
MSIQFSEENINIEGFEYPQSFLKIIELNLVDFDLWYIMSETQVLRRLEGLKERYPNRKLIPFARRDDNDDIACFEVGKGEKVQIIHDFASEGYEQRKEYMNFWEWLEAAIQEMIEFNKGD